MNSGSCIDQNDSARRAEAIRQRLPDAGLFAGAQWRVSPVPFRLGAEQARSLEQLGRVLLQFYRAANLLYRQSVEGRQPAWVARWLDQGKPAELIAWQRHVGFKNDVPRVIRPDLLLTEEGLALTELDSVPGGIGLTAWLNETYAAVDADLGGQPHDILGGADGMLQGFAGIFGSARHVHIVVSEEASMYRPEMEWLCQRLGKERFAVRGAEYDAFEPGDAVYRFYELFDLAHVPGSQRAFSQAADHQVLLTPPPKPLFEEKMLFALLWNRSLAEYWRRELGAGFLETLRAITPYTWIMDPTPLPPHGAIPELNLTDWRQLKSLSQRERNLVIKVSGFSELAWGARGVWLGSDLSLADWSLAVDNALAGFEQSPRVLQRYHKPRQVEALWHDSDRGETVSMPGRARLCPYYFVEGSGDAARARLGGVLATVCPADKKIIHGMRDAVLAPCAV